MANNLKLNEETRLLIKSSLNIEENILNLGLSKWKNKLKEFEKEHKLSTEKFVSKFSKGELGDDKKWFEWIFAYKSYNHVKGKLSLVKGITI
ncbi:hypothetical protein HYV80_04210 [Candidatus Woesearchaeota archaeon]|nr:hypothetical protein [Candidatus Woesearchaeota archaeon]